MEEFTSKMRELLPKELPSLPSWPVRHSSMNPDDDEDDGPSEAKRPSQSKRPVPDMASLEPKPISSGPKSNLDLLNECDNFPYYTSDPKLYLAHINTYYALYVKEFPEAELGYLLPSVAALFKGLPDWDLDEDDRSLTLVEGKTEEERSRAMATVTQAMKGTDHFKVLRGWRNELYPVYGPTGQLLFSVERAASALFGIVTYGVHMTAYTFKETKGSPDKGMLLWVPRRAKSKQTYGGMLDNTVAGGIATGENPFECLIREAQEEASLPQDIVRKDVKQVGTVTYFHIRDSRAGGETRLLQPECQYVYDLELAKDVVPKPNDDEVEGFELKNIGEVKEAMRNGEFKPNCALVLLDFFIRHGILTHADEGYIEIVSRLHRRLEFPTP
ncbi:hypothetical protein K431DRAFT_284693 [Polychaeton citri CBS 116435]|uniref:Nudix hydrolase domain-containing protein n=1 Tax=Polychaeton citri CBS 116435 TaxID=1314669 RepID=A0A9P4QBB7_9PEZI|nr:hypothetical protein K431DRAFT_284693 [Polychaeton citri CBS 116435]